MSPKIMVMERKMPRGAALWLAFAFCQLLCIAGQAQTANDPNVTVSPNGTNNIVYNAITESISFPAGYSQVRYSVNNGAWTPYTEPFAIDGNDPRYPFTPGGFDPVPPAASRPVPPGRSGSDCSCAPRVLPREPLP